MTKKIFRKIFKSTLICTLVVAMVVSYFQSIINVEAATYGTGDTSLRFDASNIHGFENLAVEINNNAWSNTGDEFRTNNGQYHIVISLSRTSEMGGKVPRAIYNHEWNENGRNQLISQAVIQDQEDPNRFEIVIDVDLRTLPAEQLQGLFELYVTLEVEEPGEHHEPFDGKAYVIWSCGSGVCYHYFDDIPDFDDGNSTFYKDTDVKADNNANISFDVHAEYKAWALADQFNNWKEAYKAKNNVEEIDWAHVDPEDIISEEPPRMDQWEAQAVAAYQNNPETGCRRPQEGDPGDVWEQFERCVDAYYIAAGNLPFIRLQPLGEPEYNNAYVSYGDRNFKVVIYNSDYKGIAMGDLSKLHYYPSSWNDPFIKRDQFDISGTTKNNPTGIDSILLESTVMIRPLNYNSFAIASIEALDVPEGAVEITKENNGDFRLVFSSNFYDNVVFKVTDTKGGVSYLQVKRYTIDGWINFKDNHPYLTTDFYFDREKSYNDFDLTAKIVYKDGTTKNVTLTAANRIDDGLGNITNAYEVDEQSAGGKGLKKACFEYALSDGEDRTIKDVYLNAEYKGSTASNYAGAYVGSGEGTLANIYHGEEE